MERLLGTNLYVASAAILIVTGSIVAIISFLGTFGAYKEIKCMILTYFVILVVLFIVMVTAGILGYVFRLEVDDRMQQEMHSTIKLYGNDSQVTQAWDAVQKHVSSIIIWVCSVRWSHSPLTNVPRIRPVRVLWNYGTSSQRLRIVEEGERQVQIGNWTNRARELLSEPRGRPDQALLSRPPTAQGRHLLRGKSITLVIVAPICS